MSNDIRFVYVRPEYVGDCSLTGAVTVAYRFNDEKGVVEFNTATCGKKDYFNRKVGRAVSTGRLLANKPSHPNRAVNYAEVSDFDPRTATVGPRYGVIAAVLTDIVLED